MAASGLNVRKGQGIVYKKIGLLGRGGTQTIVEEKNSCGKIESGGWISLKFTEKYDVMGYTKIGISLFFLL